MDSCSDEVEEAGRRSGAQGLIRRDTSETHSTGNILKEQGRPGKEREEREDCMAREGVRKARATLYTTGFSQFGAGGLCT